MSSLVIVAIPAEDELVWKVSSEKVPHLTLMYLGETTDDNTAQRMADFVEHALNVNQHGPFYLDVDYRGELGPDKADVLYFENGWDSKWIKSLRGQLLKQNDIRTAFEANDQFPEWVPHLTLGYPDTPAKPIPDDRKIYSVMFDRLSVWTGDYSGPEFRLKWPERDPIDLAVAYSEYGPEVVHDLLHYGVKGMRWGVRKTPSVITRPKSVMTTGQQIAVGGLGALAFVHPGTYRNYVTDTQNQRGFQADKKWEKDFNKAKSFKYDDQKFTDSYNKKWEKHDFSKEDWNSPSPTYQKYIDGYMKEMSSDYSKQFADHYGASPTGKYKTVRIGDHVHIQRVEAVHSLQDGVLVTFRISFADDGLIDGLEKVEDSMAQTAEIGKEFILAHQSVLDNPTLAQQIKDKLKSILDDVTGDADQDLALFGDPLIRTKLQSVLNDFYKDPNVDNAVIYDALGSFFLEHYGVKGMHWGIRNRSKRSTPEPVAPQATSKVPHGNRRQTKIETQGGENHPAHADAIKVAQAQAKLKKSGTAALSNQELRDVATRVQLENQVTLLTASAGRKFVRKHLTNQSDALAREGLREGFRSTTPALGKKVRRGAATAATVAALV